MVERIRGVMKKKQFFIFLIVSILISSCTGSSSGSLPYLGESTIAEKHAGDSLYMDTVFYEVPEFSFLGQDSQWVSKSSMKGKIYITDFFFTSCPSICPKMAKQKLRVYQAFIDEPMVQIISHTIDVRHDSIPVLKAYALKLGIDDAKKWHFVTGDKEKIYGMAKSYYIAAMEDEEAPGGYNHSGHFMLIDPEGHLRGAYDGTSDKDVTKLIGDIKILLNDFTTQ
jgi:protein SCO1